MCSYCNLSVGHAEGILYNDIYFHRHCYEVFRKMVEAVTTGIVDKKAD